MLAIRWYLRFRLSYRDVEELLAERGVQVDHVTVYRWVQRFTHRFEDVLARTRFGVPQQFFVPGIPDLLRDSESVVPATCPSHPRRRTHSAEGIFWDWPGDTEVVMARKPD